MTKVWIATILNFFFPGAGWIVLGRRPALGALTVLGFIGLTYVETSLKAAAPDLYMPMFGSVMAINLALAIDCFQDGKARLKG